MKRLPPFALMLAACAILLAALSLTPTQAGAMPDDPLPAGTPIYLPGVWVAPPTPTPRPTPVPTALPGVDASEMLLVPAGKFPMGCSKTEAFGCDLGDRMPLHTVNLSAYDMDKYEVTNARYKKCVDAGGCTPPQSTGSRTRATYFGDPAYDNYPVIFVDWYQASAFCTWAGKRLPTEAEWEKAARSTEQRWYPWGGILWDAPLDCTYANYDLTYNDDTSICVGDTVAVGSYPKGAGPYGHMDLAGNVREWVNDWYDYDYYKVSPVDNPQGPATGEYRSTRGGSWLSDSYYLYTADRLGAVPDSPYSSKGFRCVRTR
ncbi:MAG: formylglycine-generating enzyme family protein [Caldilineaceae bacterium]